jgi:O-antigen ligase
MALDNHQPKIYITRDLILQFVLLAICLILPLFLLTKIEILPFILIGAVVGVTLILKQPFIGLVFYLVIFYIRPQEFWFTGAVGVEKTFGIATLILTILKLKLKDNLKLRLTNIHFAIVAFLSIASINVATSYWISGSWDIWVNQFRLFIVFFCIIYLIDTEKQFKFFIMFTILATVFHAASAVIRYYQGIVHIEMGIERAFAMDTSYGDPNSLAATIIYTLPLIYYYMTKKTSPAMKIFLGIAMMLMLWCTILTGSRTGMAGIIVFALLAIWERKNKIRNFIIVGVILIIVAAAMPDQYQQRFLSIANMDTTNDETGAATSARSRIEFLVYAFEMMLQRPAFGYGMGNFGTVMATVYGQGWLQAHTLPGQIMSEMGLTGIIAFGAWIIILFLHLKRMRKYFAGTDNKFMLNMTLAMKTGLLMMLFMGLGGHNLFRYNWYIFSAIIVLMMRPEISGYEQQKAIKIETSKQLSAGDITGLSNLK